MSKKIAIFESDPELRQRLRGELEARGFAVDDAADGKAAVDLVRREKPDLVVLSAELAGSGYAVCNKLKKDEELRRIPVVMIGSDAAAFEAHWRLRTHAEEDLGKPFELAAIVERIGGLIGLPDPRALREKEERLREELGMAGPRGRG